MYVHVMGIFALFLFFSQVDFALIRLLADWLVTGFSTLWFIQVRALAFLVAINIAIHLKTLNALSRQDKEVVPTQSSARARRAAEESEERMLSDFEMTSSFQNQQGVCSREQAIITVYPRAFDDVNACLPHMSSFSITDELDENENAMGMKNDGPILSMIEEEIEQGDVVLSSNGMHVGSVHAKDRKKKSNATKARTKCYNEDHKYLLSSYSGKDNSSAAKDQADSLKAANDD
jgi:hypothetical protein